MTPHCPLCRSEADALEFHHWDYENDVGVELCGECHSAIHGGDEGRVSIQQNRAEYYGLDHWHNLAVVNLIKRDLEYFEPENVPVSRIGTPPSSPTDEEHEEYQTDRRDAWARYKGYLKIRYNLPDENFGVTDVVWGQYPVTSFNDWLKSEKSVEELYGVPEEARGGGGDA